VLPIY